ncbi:uncharacterized protein LOC109787968 [Cajanus cajan]|uniref:uncharacterized protein LOC109787968 n=1 Tax=Cajanus cajan TaxID=3821 RepID=UPI0010FAE58C|nr:uncharacterized protein LOC109787968 [Cajanus cajan]
MLEDPTKKTKPCPNFRSNGGYDRRALLLAHSQELRNEGSQNVPSHTNQSWPKAKTKPKGIWLSQPWWRSSTCGCERVVACKESKERDPNASPFLSKMKITLKQLSCKKI